MQFAVPQFTDVEDKLIGPLTLKQFMVLVAAGGLCFFFWSLPLPKVLSVILDLPIAIVGIALAFGSYNSRPALSYIYPFVTYLVSPKFMVFKRETNVAQINVEKVKKKPEPIKKVEVVEDSESRLRKLAYLLDQKTDQEQELINQTITKSLEKPKDPARPKDLPEPRRAKKEVDMNFMSFGKKPSKPAAKTPPQRIQYRPGQGQVTWSNKDQRSILDS